MTGRPLFRARHEPEEPAGLADVNAALDRIEADARAVLEAGGEVALRLRLVRVLGAGAADATAGPAGVSGARRGAGRGSRRRVAP